MVRTYFFDTSALVKRYITESGSEWVKNLCDPQAGNKVVIAQIALESFEYDWDIQYQVVGFDHSLAKEAGELVKKHPLRAYDSVQLASALKIHNIHTQALPGLFTFVSADERLLNVAKLEGMLVENPLEHQSV